MKRLVCAALAASLLGCATAHTSYRPTRGAATELTLTYDSGLKVSNQGRLLAQSPRYEGLADFVRCVPTAQRHARTAEEAGLRATLLSAFSIGFAVVGLGGLYGFHYKDQPGDTMGALLAGGVAFEVLAVVLGASSISAKSTALGNALDAVNFYNDAVGFDGPGCTPR